MIWPQRVLAASNFVYTVGSGLYLTAGVLYFTQAIHLPADEVGLGLGIAGLVALALGISVGHLADRRGARGVYAATLVVQALATASFVLANSFWPFVLAVTAAASAKAAGIAARSPLIVLAECWAGHVRGGQPGIGRAGVRGEQRYQVGTRDPPGQLDFPLEPGPDDFATGVGSRFDVTLGVTS